MTQIRALWMNLITEDRALAGTDANMFLEFNASGKSFKLPDQPGNDLERPTVLTSNATSYLFNVNNLAIEEFLPGTVVLRNDSTNSFAGWRCKSLLLVAIQEDGKVTPLSMMENVDRWLAADEPEGLNLTLDILKKSEVGFPL